MSTTESQRDNGFPSNPNKTFIITVGLAVIICAFLFKNVWDQMSARSPDLARAAGATPSNPASMAAGLEASSVSSQRFDELLTRLEQLEELVREQKKEQRRESAADSEAAVQSVKRLRFRNVLQSAEDDLGQLRRLNSDWTALWAALETSETGRRIASSRSHFELIRDLRNRPRPSAEDISQYSEELSAMAANLRDGLAEETVRLTKEHVDLLDDLGQKLTSQVRLMEEQLQLAKSIEAETASLKPGTETLQSAIESERLQREKEALEEIQKAAEAARLKIIKERSDELAKAEEKLATLKAEEELANKQHEAAMLEAKLKNDKEDKEKAKIKSELERQFQQDEKEIRSLLEAFTSDGFTYRTDDSKGPVSLQVIKSRGGLKKTRDGLQQLFYIAKTDAERPNKGLPEGVGGQIASATPLEPIERAQELLIKYGELMVEKGLLAP